MKCYHRFDHSYQSETRKVAVAASAIPSYDVDTNWYIDTGATDHITNDLDKLTVKERYNGKRHGADIKWIGYENISYWEITNFYYLSIPST